jgi:hypothetical protein
MGCGGPRRKSTGHVPRRVVELHETASDTSPSPVSKRRLCPLSGVPGASQRAASSDQGPIARLRRQRRQPRRRPRRQPRPIRGGSGPGGALAQPRPEGLRAPHHQLVNAAGPSPPRSPASQGPRSRRHPRQARPSVTPRRPVPGPAEPTTMPAAGRRCAGVRLDGPGQRFFSQDSRLGCPRSGVSVFPGPSTPAGSPGVSPRGPGRGGGSTACTCGPSRTSTDRYVAVAS